MPSTVWFSLRRAHRPTRVARLGALLSLCLLLCASALGAQTLELRFLNVGQGDATLLITPERKAVLIDAGPDRRQVATRVAAILRSERISELTVVVASHAHADHIGGMAAVLATIPVANYLDNGAPYTTATYRRTMAVVERRGIRYLRPEPRTLTVGGVALQILPLPDRLPREEQNNRSVGALVTFGRFTALFTGDAEEAERAVWRERADFPPRVTVLKVAHHGSRNGTDGPWLRALRPEVALIAAGAGNDYGHPHRGTLTLLERAGVRVLRTDQEGEVRITVQPDGRYAVQSGRSASPRKDRPPSSQPSRRTGVQQ